MVRGAGRLEVVHEAIIGAARAGEPDRYLAALLAPRTERADLLALAAFAAELARVASAVRRAGRLLDLTRTEYTLLRKLAEVPGRAVSRSELLKSIWGIEFDPGTNVVDVHVRRLRRKVDAPFAVPLIHTVRGSGYRLAERE